MGETMKPITFYLDDHDHDQVVLLAAINRVTLSKMVRQICKCYLDGRPLPPPTAEISTKAA